VLLNVGQIHDSAEALNVISRHDIVIFLLPWMSYDKHYKGVLLTSREMTYIGSSTEGLTVYVRKNELKRSA
jgi:hypothetical protein